MKKLLALVLVLTTLFAVTVITTNAAKVDSAQTSATYYVSSKPFEKITSANANVIGYLGDLDGDKELSIMDATKIQLAIAKVESDIQANITAAMDSVKLMLGKGVSGNIYTLFA